MPDIADEMIEQALDATVTLRDVELLRRANEMRLHRVRAPANQQRAGISQADVYAFAAEAERYTPRPDLADVEARMLASSDEILRAIDTDPSFTRTGRHPPDPLPQGVTPTPPPVERPIVMPEPQPIVFPHERMSLDNMLTAGSAGARADFRYEGTQRVSRAIDIFLFKLDPVRQPSRITVYVRPVEPTRRQVLSVYMSSGVRFPGIGYDAIKGAFVTEICENDQTPQQMERVVLWAKFLLKLSKGESATPPPGVAYSAPQTFMQRYALEHNHPG